MNSTDPQSLVKFLRHFAAYIIQPKFAVHPQAQADAAGLRAAADKLERLEKALRLLFYMRSPMGDKIESLLLEWGFDAEWRDIYSALTETEA